MKVEVDLEKTPCAIAFAHERITLFYCADNRQGATQDIRYATKYLGEEARMLGMNEVLRKYKQTKREGLIFHYIPQGVQ